MRRRLDFDAVPPLWVPLRFLLTAPCFGMAAGLTLAWSGAGILASRWLPATLALTHLLTLGVLTMTMLGATLQILPVVANLSPGAPRWAPFCLWLTLTFGTIALAAGMAFAFPAALATGGALLGGALLLALITLGSALFRSPDPLAAAMTSGMRAAFAAFVLTAMLGLALVATLNGKLSLDLVATVDIHAALGLAGWIGILVMATACQVVPMFQSTLPYNQRFAQVAPLTVLAGLVATSGARWHWPRLEAGATLAATALALFAAYTLAALHRRKRAPDSLTRSWQLALASLLAACAVWIWPAPWPRREWLLGLLFIGGFALTIVNGMLYKIVGFLLWHHRQARCPPPSQVVRLGQLMPESHARRQLLVHSCAIVTLLAGVLGLPPAARMGGLLLFASQALAGWDFVRALRMAAATPLEECGPQT